jgi:hypothetical protein
LFQLAALPAWGRQPPAAAPGASPATAAAAPAAPPPAPAAGTTFRVEPRSYGTRPETEPPRYTRPAADTGVGPLAGVDWLVVGLEYRLRYEFRDSDYRRPVDTVDEPLLLRGRAFAYVRNRFDPFRFGIELQDSRRLNSQFPEDDRDVNVLEPIQAWGELHFDDALGSGRPVSLRAGRFAFELLDRRFIARNEWRNTTNTWQGLRATVGGQLDPWQLELLALQPLERQIRSLDEADRDRWLYGATFEWHRWSAIATLQPTWFLLTQSADPAAGRQQRRIHTMALRAYANLGTSGADYDVNAAWQTGSDGNRNHRAFGGVAELGYTWDARWRPRLSAQYVYATGDAQPDDRRSGRFERLFGFQRPFSASDYIQWENLRAPKLRVEFSPAPTVRVDAGWSRYALDSATDRWNAAGLRDPTGAAGRSIGTELDARVRFPLGGHVAATIGYAWFRPGRFTETTSGRDADSNFLYMETYLNAFR